MTCVNHPQTQAVLVPWWPYTHFLDMELGICAECAAGDCSDLHLVRLESEEFWAAFRDMTAWKGQADA